MFKPHGLVPLSSLGQLIIRLFGMFSIKGISGGKMLKWKSFDQFEITCFYIELVEYC